MPSENRMELATVCMSSELEESLTDKEVRMRTSADKSTSDKEAQMHLESATNW